MNREFFRIPEEDVINLLEMVEGKDVTPRDDQFEDTNGYMAPGLVPTFIIYDASEHKYYNTVASEEVPWESYGFNYIGNLNVGPDWTRYSIL